MKKFLIILLYLTFVNTNAQNDKFLENEGFIIDGNLNVVQSPQNSIITDLNGDQLKDILYFKNNILYHFEATLKRNFVLKRDWTFIAEIEHVELGNEMYSPNALKISVTQKNGSPEDIYVNKFENNIDDDSINQFSDVGEFNLVWRNKMGTGQSEPLIFVNDYNRNGKLDLGIIYSHSWGDWDPGEIRIYENDGDNSYKIIHSYIDSGVFMTNTDIGDADMDGYPELVFQDRMPLINYIYEFDPQLSQYVKYSFSHNIFLASIGVQDYNGDLKNDMIVHAIALRSGPSTKSKGPYFWSFNYPWYHPNDSIEFSIPYGVYEVKSANLDDDPRPELVIGSPGSFTHIPIYDFNPSLGRWEEVLIPNPTQVGLLAPDIFDYDGDGKKDLILSGGGFAVFKNLGNFQFQLVYYDDMLDIPSHLIHTWRTRHATVQGGHLVAVVTDYDSLVGIVMVELNTKVFTWWYDSATQQWSRLWTSPKFRIRSKDVRIADPDNDGKLSLLFTVQYNHTYVFDYERNVVTNISEVNTTPTDFALYQNYPNPFNPGTVISYQLSAFSYVVLKIFDVLGNEVATLVNEEKEPGVYNYQLSIDNYQLQSGVYFYQLRVGNSSAGSGQDFVETKKMILLR